MISTHALREEGDTRKSSACVSRSTFLPTPSARRATISGWEAKSLKWISTHALREEGDVCAEVGRHDDVISTHALREEGDGMIRRYPELCSRISTHALREEGDFRRGRGNTRLH